MLKRGHKIVTSYESTPGCWSAIFDDYDGAPDSRHPIGLGPTELSAVAALLEQERERDSQDDALINAWLWDSAPKWARERE